MKLVVEIPEEQYITLNAKSQEEVVAVLDDRLLINAIKNGIPLPKGHGDLKDADKLKHAFIKWSMVVQGSFTDSDIASIVYNSPTIIEADKEQEDGNDN